MSNVSGIHTSSQRRLVRQGEPVSKPKAIHEVEASEQLNRIAPDWPLHLYDGMVIDHILEVINQPRASRTEITRRYRARRAAAGSTYAAPRQ